MSQPPPSQQPGQDAASGGGFGPQTPPPAPNTPPSAPPLPPAGQPGQPGYGYPQQAPTQQPAAPPVAQPAQPTQPAQPAVQPPAPPQAPYGYPQQPPGQPGQPPQGVPGAQQPPAQSPYGYPQPAPPPGGQGFGTAAQPGPYTAGHTPPPGTAPQGWGQQPGMTPPGRSGGGRARVALIVVAALVLLLAAGGGAVWMFSGDDEQKPSADASEEADGGGGEGGDLPGEPIEATLAWQTPRPEVSAEDIILGARGSWLTDDTLVRTLDNAVVGYDLATGEERWSLPMELSGGDCNASPTASENRIAVLQGRDCEVLTVVDIAAGEELTSISLELDAGYLTDTSYPAFLGDTIALGWGTGGAGYDATTGEQLWTTSSEEDCPEVAYVVMDDMFVSQTQCGFVGDEGGSIRATNEAGEELWEWEHGTSWQGKELRVHSVLSVEPLVVTAWLNDDIEQESILVIDENHQEISHALDYNVSRYQSPCMVNTLNDCKMAVVHDGFLYLATNVRDGQNEVVAFELSSGQPLYEVSPDTSDGGPSEDAVGREIRPFAVHEGRILAYQRDTYDDTTPGMVLAIDPATEEATPVMRLDPSTTAVESEMGSPIDPQEVRLLWHDNTLLMLCEAFYEGDVEQREATLVYR